MEDNIHKKINTCYNIFVRQSGKVTVPNHNKDLKTGTLKSILKQAGL